MITWSRRSILYIHEEWGIPEPYNMAIFIGISLLTLIIAKSILGKLFSRKGTKGGQNYRFNAPDFAEIGVLVNNVRKLHEEVSDIKKAVSNGGNNTISDGSLLN